VEATRAARMAICFIMVNNKKTEKLVFSGVVETHVMHYVPFADGTATNKRSEARCAGEAERYGGVVRHSLVQPALEMIGLSRLIRFNSRL
jgi:hypothetical protein